MQQDDNTSSKSWDLIIIGAGIYGIQVARTFLELHPAKQVIILEASQTLGGVWSRERIYNDFWTQTPVGILEFSDRPLHEISKNEQFNGFFKAIHVAEYLETYCSSHTFDGRSLTSRIEFGTSVVSVEKVDKSWAIETTNCNGFNGRHQASQMVDASGLTSQPNWPDLIDRESFKGKILHHKEFAKWQRSGKSERSLRIAVLGGAKSAADIAYSCAKTGHNVTWIIRRSGSGPASFVSSKGSLGYKNSNESFYTRFTALFLASLFSFRRGYDRVLSWLHATSAGRALVQRVWRHINAKAWKEAKYDRLDGQKNGFSNLKPDTELFWQNDSTGINQRAEFFDVIARQVTVIREDISHMTTTGLLLEDGFAIDVDVVICATGWKIQHPYFDDTTASRLGLPVDVRFGDPADEDRWSELLSQAQQEITEMLPILDSDWSRQTASQAKVDAAESTPFRLWRSMVPLRDPSIIFVGRLMLGNHFRNAEVQALFACAVLSGVVELPSIEKRELDVARTIAWCRKRYPGGKGRLGHWMYWDMVPYTDMLLDELELHSHRASSLWQDLFRPCFAKDLRGLIQELKARLA